MAAALIELKRPTAAPLSKRSFPLRPDQLVALALTAVIVLLHILFSPGLGGLWRDEVNTLNLATLPTWHDLWSFHDQDSFPLLFAVVVRIWSGFFGAGDESLRLLGLLIGLGTVAAFWINARLLGLRFPFWSLALVGANPLVIRYGDSLRAYGLGLLLLLVMFGLIWRLARTPGAGWFAAAAVVSVLAVHALYYNAVLLFALGMAGCAVAWHQRQWRSAIAVLAVGGIAGISMLPYLPMFLHAHDWNFLVQYPFTLSWMWQRIAEVIGSPERFGVLVWLALCLAAVVVGSFTVARRGEASARALYCGVALLVGVAAYAGFLKLLNYYTQAWYYLALIAFVAACIDPILAAGSDLRHQVVRAVALALFVGLTAVSSLGIIAVRHTNIDLAAEALRVMAAPEDLVLVTRWECGVTMNRYYKGPAPWMTIPPLDDFRFQAYQPVMERMKAEDPLRPIFQRAEETLRGGHKVWLVGEIPKMPPGAKLPSLPRVVESNPKWRGSSAFYTMWVLQVTHFLDLHATESAMLAGNNLAPVSEFENLPVRSVSGWK